jgi:hypothetical protein
MTLSDAAQLLRMEYAEMPGLALTAQQAQKLCDLSSEQCTGALEILIEIGFLKRTASGLYLRRDEGPPTITGFEKPLREAS